MATIAQECFNTLTYPAKALWQREGTKVVLLAIAILMICAHYADTQPMKNFNKGMSEIGLFIKNNPCCVALIGSVCGLFYLVVGRELVNHEKTPFMMDDRRPKRLSESTILSLLWPFVLISMEKDDNEKKYESELKELILNRKSTRIIGILLLGIVILAICAHYVDTRPMKDFNKVFSDINTFSRDPVHASLISIIAALFYVAIGRETYYYNFERGSNPDMAHEPGYYERLQARLAAGPPPPSYDEAHPQQNN